MTLLAGGGCRWAPPQRRFDNLAFLEINVNAVYPNRVWRSLARRAVAEIDSV